MNEQGIISFIERLDTSSSEIWEDEFGKYEIIIGYGTLESLLKDNKYIIIPTESPSKLFLSEINKTIISVGGFQAHNIGKQEAEKLNCSLITVPGPLSNDSFGTNRYSIGIDEQSPSIKGIYPIKTVFDIKHILEIELIKSLWGIGEFIGLYYSIIDYSLLINKDYSLLLNYIEKRIELFNSALKRDDESSIIRSIASSLVLKCLTMRVNHDHSIGCGIDHSFARCFEKKYNIVHGKAVFLGSILSSALYPEWSGHSLSTDSLIELGEKLGILPEDYSVIGYCPLNTLIRDAIEIRPNRSSALKLLTKQRINNAIKKLQYYGIYYN